MWTWRVFVELYLLMTMLDFFIIIIFSFKSVLQPSTCDIEKWSEVKNQEVVQQDGAGETHQSSSSVFCFLVSTSS